MQTSVIIIAHNEEKFIKECIESVLNQTKKPNEVILIVHNSTDKTYEISQKYPIKIIKFDGEIGIVNARIKGIKEATNDIIICIDGDSIAKNNWVDVMVKTLSANNILVGSYVKFKGTIFGQLSNIFNKYYSKTKNKKALRWIWGPSFAFWKKDSEKVVNILSKSIDLSNNLSLTRNPDDFWLALYMGKESNIEVTNETYVIQNQKEKNSFIAIKRNLENIKNGKIMEKFINNKL